VLIVIIVLVILMLRRLFPQTQPIFNLPPEFIRRLP